MDEAWADVNDWGWLATVSRARQRGLSSWLVTRLLPVNDWRSGAPESLQCGDGRWRWRAHRQRRRALESDRDSEGASPFAGPDVFRPGRIRLPRTLSRAVSIRRLRVRRKQRPAWPRRAPGPTSRQTSH